jgi:hypothetical protein
MNVPLLAFLLFISGAVFLLSFIADREVAIRAEKGLMARIPPRVVIANPNIILASDRRSPYTRNER